jgi:hypothetical protein
MSKMNVRGAEAEGKGEPGATAATDIGPALTWPVPRPPCGRCRRQHRTVLAVATCKWPAAIWICGNPRGRVAFALLARCGGLTVTLHKTREAAQQARQRIDRTGCCGGCCRVHRIVRIAVKGDRSR